MRWNIRIGVNLFAGSRESDEFRDEGLNPILPEELFQRYVIPEVFHVFHVYNVHIRLTLLRHFESYVHLFAVDTLEEFIFPQVSTSCLTCLVQAPASCHVFFVFQLTANMLMIMLHMHKFI